ncbi:MAG: lysophospholipid acyltransferase family protein [Thermodesulfobacteriota bacterium]
MAVRRDWGRALLLMLAPRLYGLLARLLFATCRVEVLGHEHRRQAELAGRSLVAAFWHYAVFCVVELHRGEGRGWAAMVSASRDAEFVARILEGRGFVTVRGSSNRRGVTALKGLIALMRNGCNAAIVADGSQGPARRMQPGALLLAGKSGAMILPIAVAADRYWAFGSWDRTLLPKPFATMVLAYGEPMAVAEGLSAQELEQARLGMEQRLNLLYDQAWRRFGLPAHDRREDHGQQP